MPTNLHPRRTPTPPQSTSGTLITWCILLGFALILTAAVKLDGGASTTYPIVTSP